MFSGLMSRGRSPADVRKVEGAGDLARDPDGLVHRQHLLSRETVSQISPRTNGMT